MPPDILIRSITFSPDPPIQGQPMTVMVTVGADRRITADIEVALSQDGFRFPLQTVARQPDGTGVARFTRTPPASGESTFIATIDPNDRIQERFEYNNTLTRTIPIAGSGN